MLSCHLQVPSRAKPQQPHVEHNCQAVGSVQCMVQPTDSKLQFHFKTWMSNYQVHQFKDAYNQEAQSRFMKMVAKRNMGSQAKPVTL